MAQPRHRTAEVLQMLKEATGGGLPVSVIAARCGVSEKTANTFVAHLKEEGFRIVSVKGIDGVKHFWDPEGKMARALHT
jgi:biotin operon repressor